MLSLSISQVQIFWQRLNRNRLTTVGLLVFVLVAILCIITPFLPLKDPDATDLVNRLLPPFVNDEFFLGTDQLGRDVLSRLLWGTRVSLLVGFVATLVAAFFGSVIGLVSGYFRNWLDTLLMRGIDTLMAFPYILLALAIVAAFGPGLLNALFAIAVVNIPFFARTVRGVAIGLANKEFIHAARLGGASHLEIIWKELFPGVLPVIVVTVSTTSGWMILETAGLSFLGLGAQPPTADLGSMLGEGRKLLFTNPIIATIPGVVILIVVITLNILGDGIRDILDPRLRSGALRSPSPRTLLDKSVDNTQMQVKKTNFSEETILSVEQLSINLRVLKNSWELVDEISIQLKKGECLGVVGESGCGKSVMALSLTGLASSPPLEIKRGKVFFQDNDLLTIPLRKLQDIRGGKIAYIFQDPLATLNPVHTIGEQLLQTIRRHQSNLDGRAAKQLAIDFLNKVNIPNANERFYSYPHNLSGGMRQRVCIAIALVNQPEILIADEPTTALDVTIQAEILALLKKLQKEMSLAVIFITHDLGVVSALCERVMVMYAGRIVEEGKTDELLNAPSHPYTKALLKCIPELGMNKKLAGGIPGMPPQPSEFGEGCRFASRCEFARKECNEFIALKSLKSKSVEGSFENSGDSQASHGRKIRCIDAVIS